MLHLKLKNHKITHTNNISNQNRGNEEDFSNNSFFIFCYHFKTFNLSFSSLF